MSSTPVLKGSSFTFSILQLVNDDVPQALKFLQDKVAQAPNFFRHAPLVINIEKLASPPAFTELKNGIEALGMYPVGVVGCNTTHAREVAFEAGLATLQSVSTSDLKVPKDTESRATEVIRTPVRSGQQIYVKGRDLVILGHVSNGAEVIADGSIQIYGTLRGRAIAGAAGDTEAHIICQNLQAELCSIAGHYWLSEQIDAQYWEQAVIVTRADDSLVIDPIRI